jgi:hypothetical protein
MVRDSSNDHVIMSISDESELEAIKRAARSSEGKTPEERIAMFIKLMEEAEKLQAHLTPEEREKRRRIAEQIDPRPEPWWRNFRKEALEEYARTHKEEQENLDRPTEECSRDIRNNP